MAKFLKSMLAIAAVTAVSATCGPAMASSPPYHTTVVATKCPEAPADVTWENIPNEGLFLVIHFDGEGQEEGGFYFPGIQGHSVQPLTFLAKFNGSGNLYYEAEDTNGNYSDGYVTTRAVANHPGYYNCEVSLNDFDFANNAKFKYLYVYAYSDGCEKGTATITHIEVGGVLSTPNLYHVVDSCD